MAARIRPVIWATGASAALDEVVAYVARDSPQAAVDFLERALQVADSLSMLPERGRVVPELRTRNVREVFVHRYRLLYRVDETRIVVIAFIHGSRDFADWRREQESR